MQKLRSIRQFAIFLWVLTYRSHALSSRHKRPDYDTHSFGSEYGAVAIRTVWLPGPLTI
jgi:hypothetical protein